MAISIPELETTLEPGDRFELAFTPDGGRLPLPDYLRANHIPDEQLTDASGRSLPVQWQPEEHSLIVPDLRQLSSFAVRSA